MKKQTFKKLTALLLVLALIPVFSLFTLAADDVVSGTWGNLEWTLDQATGLLTISGEGEMESLNYADAWQKYRSGIKP